MQSRPFVPKSLGQYNWGMSDAAGTRGLNLRDLALSAASISHLLAWVAFVLLVFAPFYHGASVTATAPGAIPSQPVQATATFIEVNGWGVLPIVLTPVAISGVGLLGVILAGPGLVWRRAPLGVSTLLLLGFCIVGRLSIGVLYLPAALAMALAGAVSLGQRKERAVDS